jgi:hypothetical protein
MNCLRRQGTGATAVAGGKMWSVTNVSILFFFFFFFLLILEVLGIELRAYQALHGLSHGPSPFAFLFVFHVLCFLPGTVSHHNPATSLSLSLFLFFCNTGI